MPLHPESPPRFTGCWTATLAPFDASGRFDAGLARAHAEWLAASGAAGLCTAGTTGEFLYLSGQEKMSAARAAVEGSAGAIPVMAGVWSTDAAERTALCRAAQLAGAAAVFLQPPIYYPAPAQVIAAYYRSVAAASPLPVLAYNIPKYAANEIPIETAVDLLSDGALLGIKDSSASEERLSALVAARGTRQSVFAASDSFASRARLLGADGFITAIGNVLPGAMAAIWNGDESLQPAVDVLRAALHEAGSIAGLKYLLARRGFVFGASRVPAAPLTESHQARLDAAAAEITDRGG